jgi:hypothetical protein
MGVKLISKEWNVRTTICIDSDSRATIKADAAH